RHFFLDNLAGSQILDQCAVGLEEIEVQQFFPAYPADFAKNTVFDFALVLVYFKKAQFDRAAARVFMMNAGDFITDGGFDSEFFFEFAAQGIARLFAFLDLAAGEFPLERHHLMARALACQNPAIVHDQSSNYSLSGHSEPCDRRVLTISPSKRLPTAWAQYSTRSRSPAPTAAGK